MIHRPTCQYQTDVPSDRGRTWEFIDGSWGYDVARYTELLMRAVESVLVPFGLSANMLRSWLIKELQSDNLQSRLEARSALVYWKRPSTIKPLGRLQADRRENQQNCGNSPASSLRQ